MLIVIPTYKRNHSLNWVLQSLVQCRTESIDEPIRVLIVNNYPPAKDEIKTIVGEFTHHKQFEWDALCREKTLPPVENWYSAILQKALPDEVVLLHGDDDILCPWGIEERYHAITCSDVDILLTRSRGCIVFLADPLFAVVKGKLPHKEMGSNKTAISLGEINTWGPAFIGNHCYRNTKRWREALCASFNWCHQQDWLDWNTRTLMLPFYLPFAAKLVGCNIVGLNQACVIRGISLEENTQSPYGSPTWNSGILAVCAYGVLSEKPLGELSELEPARIELKNMALQWLVTLWFDPRIPASIRRKTLRRIRLPLSMGAVFQVSKGLRLLIGEILGLRGWRLKLYSKKNAKPVPEILKSLANNPQ